MSDWLAWQVVDSAFPTGGFVHSGGLEASWQQGEVRDLDELRRFLRSSILQAGHAAIPFVNAAYRAPGRLEAIDEVADAFLLGTVANRASRSQGRTLAATAAAIWPSREVLDLKTRAAAMCAHHAPLVGAVFQVVGLPLETVQRLVLYSTVRNVAAAAVRLGIAGGYEAQRLQYESAAWLDRVARECHAFDLDDLAQTAPLIDLLQGGHDRLYSRLFQS